MMDADEAGNQRVCPRVPLPNNSVLMDSCGQEHGITNGNISVSGCGLSFESDASLDDFSAMSLEFPVAGKLCSLSIDCLRHSKGSEQSMQVAGRIHDLSLSDCLSLCEYINQQLRQATMRSVFHDGINFKAAF